MTVLISLLPKKCLQGISFIAFFTFSTVHKWWKKNQEYNDNWMRRKIIWKLWAPWFRSQKVCSRLVPRKDHRTKLEGGRKANYSRDSYSWSNRVKIGQFSLSSVFGFQFVRLFSMWAFVWTPSKYVCTIHFRSRLCSTLTSQEYLGSWSANCSQCSTTALL